MQYYVVILQCTRVQPYSRNARLAKASLWVTVPIMQGAMRRARSRCIGRGTWASPYTHPSEYGELLLKSAGIINSEGAAERAHAIAASPSGVGTVGNVRGGQAGVAGAMARGAPRAAIAGVVPEGVGGAGGVDDAQVGDAHAVVQGAPTVAAAPRVDDTARMAATRDAARRGAALSSACARGIKCNVM